MTIRFEQNPIQVYIRQRDRPVVKLQQIESGLIHTAYTYTNTVYSEENNNCILLEA